MTIAVSAQQYITVSPKTAEELVKDVFIGTHNASCISVSNVSVKGWQDFGNNPFSYGYFEKGTLPFDIAKGVILSTGNAQNAPGPNNKLLDDQDANWLGDDDLATALGGSASSYRNATVLEFDFIANYTSGISFEYAFFSEEYRPVNCQYSDGFAFLIKKAGTSDAYENIALVPGTLDPVTSLSINPSPNCPRNVQYFGGFNTDNGGINSPTAFDGQTKVLTAKADIVPGEKYHIKLVIADHLAGSDRTGRYDSAVFLKAGSFVGKKDLGPDLLIENHNPVCEGETKTLDATTTGATSYQWFKDGAPLPGETGAKLLIQGIPSNNGTYSVEINVDGCVLLGTIRVEIQEKAIITHGTYSFCDNDLSGGVPIDFTALSTQIIPNFSSAFVVKYYLTQSDAQNGMGTPLPDGWKLTADRKIFVRVESTSGCLPVLGEIHLEIGKKIALLKSTYSVSVCDNDRSGEISVDLQTYVSEFTADPAIALTFFDSVADAKINKNPISALQTVGVATKTFGVRFESSSACPNVAELIIITKTPNISAVLKDKTICENSTTTLDAGPGFDYYKWSTGQEGVSVSRIDGVAPGDYWVDLSSNGCVYRQNVKVTAAELPQITNIDVTGNTVTVFVRGGVAPYRYSLDNVNFQSSNIFLNVPRGKHTVYVTDALNCGTVQKDFLILNLINVITPNGDGQNDVLNYSDLRLKNEVSLEIYDRFGNPVFKSQNKNFIWDGKLNGRGLPTGTYWYILSWVEPDTNLPASYKGWILLKNRN